MTRCGAVQGTVQCSAGMTHTSPPNAPPGPLGNFFMKDWHVPHTIWYRISGAILSSAVHCSAHMRSLDFMLCSAVQCSAVQCSAVQCRAVQRSAVQCSAVQCSAVQCSAVQCNSVQWSEGQCNAVQCSAVQWSQCSAVQCSAVQCSAVQCDEQQDARHSFLLFRETCLSWIAIRESGVTGINPA